jgi:hypothetical protein
LILFDCFIKRPGAWTADLSPCLELPDISAERGEVLAVEMKRSPRRRFFLKSLARHSAEALKRPHVPFPLLSEDPRTKPQ